MVTITGSVPPATTGAAEQPSRRQFRIDTSVYDISKASSVQYSAVCFFEDTKRWEKVKTPGPGSFLTVTAKLVGRTAETNLLALRVLDLAYLPRTSSASAVSTPVATPTPKRPGRWEGRVTSTTPSKRPRISDPTPATPPESSTVAVSFEAEDQVASAYGATSPSTAAPGDDPLTLSQGVDPAARPHRNRHPPKKYDLD